MHISIEPAELPLAAAGVWMADRFTAQTHPCPPCLHPVSLTLKLTTVWIPLIRWFLSYFLTAGIYAQPCGSCPVTAVADAFVHCGW